MNDFTDIVSKAMEVRPDEGDYTGKDGLPPCSDVTGIPRTAPVSKNAWMKSGWLTSSASMRTP